MTSPAKLWDRLCAALHSKGLMPPGNATPAEIAAQADSLRGGDSISKFVQDFYYPWQFGGGSPAMSPEDAEAIVLELERKKTVQAPQRKPPPTSHGEQTPTQRPRGEETLQDLIERAPPGAEIVVPAGRYGSPITIDKPVTLVGSGVIGDVVIETTSVTAVVVDATVTLRRLVIRSAGSFAQPLPALEIRRGRGHIEDCVVRAAPGGDGIWLNAGAEPVLRRVRIEDVGRVGVWIASAAGGVLDGCHVTRTGLTGVLASGNARIVACEIQDTGAAGIELHEGTSRVERTRVQNAAASGVIVAESASVTLSDCRLHANKGAGVLVAKKSGATLKQCDVRDNVASGIEVQEEATGKVQSCRVHKNGHAGMLFHPQAVGAVEDTSVHDNKTCGIEVGTSADVTLQRTYLVGNGDYGLRVHAQGKCALDRSTSTGHARKDVFFEDD